MSGRVSAIEGSSVYLATTQTIVADSCQPKPHAMRNRNVICLTD